MNRTDVIQAIISQLERELASYERSARSAHAEATDEQSKAENKYDTRGLEASYLAKGQSKQAAECIDALELFHRLLEVKTPETLDIGSLVELRHSSEPAWYFIGPRSGGTEVEANGGLVVVLTPGSPLGAELVGKRVGDVFQFPPGPRGLDCRVVQVL